MINSGLLKSRRRLSGFTLSEVMVAFAVGMMVMAAVAFMTLYGSRTSVSVINYTDLETKSRYALDLISREIRQSQAVLSFQTNLAVKSITLTNADQAATISLSYDPAARTV